MEKIRFSCPRCATVMQTHADRINDEVACPQCRHQFRLVENEDSTGSGSAYSEAPTMPPQRVQDSPYGSQGSQPVKQEDSGPSSWRPPSNPPVGIHPMPNAQLPLAGGYAQPQGFCCPYCRTTQPPRWKSEISQTGWLVFAILLLTTCFFCWIGLLIKDRYRVCSQCNVRLE